MAERTSLRGLLLCCGWRRGLGPQCVGARGGAREPQPTRTGACGRSASRVATVWKRYASAVMTISSASGRGRPENLPSSRGVERKERGAKLRLRASGAGRGRLASRRPRVACSSRVFRPAPRCDDRQRGARERPCPAPRPSHKADRRVRRVFGLGGTRARGPDPDAGRVSISERTHGLTGLLSSPGTPRAFRAGRLADRRLTRTIALRRRQLR